MNNHAAKLLRLWPMALIPAGALVGLFLLNPGTGVIESGAGRTWTIGVVHPTRVDTATFEGFRAGLAELGYTSERVSYLYPGPSGTGAALEQTAADMVAAGVDLIFVSSTPGSEAVRKAVAGTTIPVVFAPVNDPVGAGITTGLRHPGGRLTGVRLAEGDDLRLEWLLRVAPDLRNILFPYNPNDGSAAESLRQVRDVAKALGVALIPHPVSDAGDIAATLRDLRAFGSDAVFLPRDSLVESEIGAFAEAARRAKLPLCAPGLDQVEAGALLSYGFSHREIGRQAALMADQILQGIPPEHLPVVTARNYLALNLATAEAVGVHIDDVLLRQAHILVRPKHGNE